MFDFIVYIALPLLAWIAVIALAIACFPMVPPLLIVLFLLK